MKFGIVGKKIGMTQVYDGNTLVPVSVIDTSGLVVTQLKTKEKDGYSAIQLGIGEMKPQNVNKAKAGHFKKANTAARRRCLEVRVESDEVMNGLAPGKELALSEFFAAGDMVDVIGTSKGKGFQGVMKRHNMRGAPGSHGCHEYFRHGGSIGTNTDPGRVMKNRKMPGHMGDARTTVLNLKVVDVQENLLLVRGAIPGANTNVVYVRHAVKTPKKAAEA